MRVTELLSQGIPALPGLEPIEGLSGDIFSSLSADLSRLLADLSAGPVGQAVTEVGVDTAVLTSLAVDPTWIEVILGAL
jgi:hypothetical protein